MTEILTALFAVSGAFFMVLAGLGMLRLQDLFLRLQAASKAATFGAGGLLGAAAVSMWNLSVVARVLLTIIFIFAIMPLAAQMVARAALRTGVPLWEKTRENDLAAEWEAVPREEPKLGPRGKEPPIT